MWTHWSSTCQPRRMLMWLEREQAAPPFWLVSRQTSALAFVGIYYVSNISQSKHVFRLCQLFLVQTIKRTVCSFRVSYFWNYNFHHSEKCCFWYIWGFRHANSLHLIIFLKFSNDPFFEMSSKCFPWDDTHSCWLIRFYLQCRVEI
jgi:hypothetical protein